MAADWDGRVISINIQSQNSFLNNYLIFYIFSKGETAAPNVACKPLLFIVVSLPSIESFCVEEASMFIAQYINY